MNLLLRRALISVFVAMFGIFVITADSLAASCASNEYTGVNGSCVMCSSINWYYQPFTKTCGNGTLTCKPYAYKARMSASSNGYICFPCPGIQSDDLQVSGWDGTTNSDRGLSNASTWQTSSRCTLVQSRGNDGSGCESNVKYTPSSSCITNHGYSAADMPVNGVDLYPDMAITCQYDRAVQYTNPLPGYRLSGTGYGNSCLGCGTNQYSLGGNGTSCSQCPYYTGTGPSSPWGSWGECQAIMEGLDTSGNLGSQATGAGMYCVSGAALTDSTGTYFTGSCTIEGENAFIITVATSNYCQNSVLGGISGKICSNVFHCNSYECEGCNNQNGWITGFGCQLYNGNPTSSSATVLCPSLYSAQRFVSAVITQEAGGCIAECHIY